MRSGKGITKKKKYQKSTKKREETKLNKKKSIALRKKSIPTLSKEQARNRGNTQGGKRIIKKK